MKLTPLLVVAALAPPVSLSGQGQPTAKIGRTAPLQKPKPHRGTLLVEAARILVGPETELRDSAILVRDGKVLFVGQEIPADAKRGAERVAFPGATILAGMVNPHCSLGLGTKLAERIDTFTPELLAADAFDPFVDELQQAAHAGVTTVGLAPSSLNAFAGQGAAVHTGQIGEVVVESTYLKMSMVDAAFDQNRFPTSRMGAADLIRNAFKRARSPLGGDLRVKVLADVLNGGRHLALHAESEAELRCVLDLCEELKVKPLLVGCREAHKVLDRIAALASGAVLAPLEFGSPEHYLTLPAALEKRGVPFSFMAERHDGLRISAALAVRNGASAKAALHALTDVAATHADANTLVGDLREGKSADFVVFSGPPLDLTSRLLRVYIAGVPVAGDAAQASAAQSSK